MFPGGSQPLRGSQPRARSTRRGHELIRRQANAWDIYFSLSASPGDPPSHGGSAAASGDGAPLARLEQDRTLRLCGWTRHRGTSCANDWLHGAGYIQIYMGKSTAAFPNAAATRATPSQYVSRPARKLRSGSRRDPASKSSPAATAAC